MTENMLRHKRDDGAGNGVHSLTVTTGAAGKYGGPQPEYIYCTVCAEC